MFFSASFIQPQFPQSCTHSHLSQLAPLQPGTHSQRPVTWWQLELWAQSHLCSQPSPKNPLEQASDKKHKRSRLACNITAKDALLEDVYLLYAWKANCTNCFDIPGYTLSASFPGVNKPFCCWYPNVSKWSTGACLSLMMLRDRLQFYVSLKKKNPASDYDKTTML